MRLGANKQFRRLCCLATFALLAFAALWVYIVATRSPISARGFHELRLNMKHADVERILGGPATKVEDLRALPDILEFDTNITYLPRKSPKIGDLTGKVLELMPPITDIRPVAEQHVWDGPEGRLWVMYDEQDRLAAAGFVARVTWRHKLQEWLPWIR